MRKKWAREVLKYSSVPLVRPPEPDKAAARMLLDLNALARSAPADTLQRFANVRDHEIAGYAATASRQLHGDKFVLATASTDSEDLLLLAIAGQMRALDDFLFETRASFGPSKFAADNWRHDTGSNQGFVIPRTYTRRASTTKGDRAPDIGSFAHRVLQRTRILPDAVGCYAVRPYPMEGRLQQSAEATFGAGLFGGLTLELGGDDKTFRVTGVKCPKQADIAHGHIQRGHEECCSVVALPELTVDPSLRQEIVRWLKERPWLTGDHRIDWTTTFIIAGSWHEEEGGNWFNVATVLDGWGDVLLKHRKLFPYLDPKGKLEAIASGDEIPVLVLEDALVAFGVCRDYCERAGADQPNPYVLLDVDLCAITSFGSSNTMKNHLKTADDVRVKFRTNSFIVQQSDAGAGEIGFVLTPYDPPDAQAAALAKNSEWTRAPALKDPIKWPRTRPG